jgi:carbon storage regulator
MLVISRRKGQRIAIGDEIELVVTELHRSSVKLGIRAPRGYAVLRGEVRDSIEEANRDAAETVLDGMQLDAPTAGSGAAKPPTDLLRVRQTAGDGASAGTEMASDTITTLTLTAGDGPEIIVRRRSGAKQPAPNPKGSSETP